MEQSIHFGVILPNTKLFGGVRRFFELGKILHRKGHRMTIFSPEGQYPDWFEYPGEVQQLSSLDQYALDVLIITEHQFLKELVQANARVKCFYHVGPRAKLNDVLKHKDIIILANSTNMYLYDKKKYGIEAVKAVGGVHISKEPKILIESNEPFTIMCYGRLSRKGKGTGLVVRAAEKLHRLGYNVKLILFDKPLDEKSQRKIDEFKTSVPFEFILNHPVDQNEVLFKRADVFVAVEKKGGWCNTAAEAMACGVPVVASKTGTADFLIDGVTGLKVWRHPYFIRRALQKLIKDISLRRKLADHAYQKIQEFGWEPLSERMLEIARMHLS